MGFPIKKRIASVVSEDVGPAPCGLDLLSAAVDSRPVEPTPKSTSVNILEGSIASQSSRTNSPEACSDGEHSARPPAKSSSSKRAKPFPEILLDILNDPTCSSIVSWLPDGQSFAVLDMAEFSSYVLPKYFRRVIFRSFVRKLNRWGFWTVKRGTAGNNVGPTFEHECFKRESPELVARIYCKSNPSASKAATKSATKSNKAASKSKKADVKEPSVTRSVSVTSTASTDAAVQVHQAAPIRKGGIQSIATHAVQPIATPISGISPSVPTTAVSTAAALVAQAAPVVPIAQTSIHARNDEILARLGGELLLREMERRRQCEALAMQELVRQRQLERQMEASTDMAFQYSAVKLQQQLGGQLGTSEYGVAARFW